MNLVGKVLISTVVVFLAGDVADTFREVKDIQSKRPTRVEIIYPDTASVLTADGMRYIFSCSRRDSHGNCKEYGVEAGR